SGPPGLVSTACASLRLLDIVTTMPASARLAHAADPGAIWSQFSLYTPLRIFSLPFVPLQLQRVARLRLLDRVRHGDVVVALGHCSQLLEVLVQQFQLL